MTIFVERVSAALLHFAGQLAGKHALQHLKDAVRESCTLLFLAGGLLELEMSAVPDKSRGNNLKL